MESAITPENAASLVQGATPIQILTLVFVGVVAVSAIFIIVKWLIDVRLKSIEDVPAKLDNIMEQLHANAITVTKIEASLWSKEEILRSIQNEIACHKANCPAFIKERSSTSK